MSWMKETRCPVCGSPGFDPDCDSVDVGVGEIEGNRRGRCPSCGEVSQCGDCGTWLHELRTACPCVLAERVAERPVLSGTRLSVRPGAYVAPESVQRAERDALEAWAAETFLPGQRVSLDVLWGNGHVSRMTGRLLLLKEGEAFVETELGSVVGPEGSLEREEEEEPL